MDLYQSCLSKQHTLEDVLSGKSLVGVEGDSGRDMVRAKLLGLFTCNVKGVDIFAKCEADARPLIHYLERGGVYGSVEFSRLLGYTDEEIQEYAQLLTSSQGESVMSHVQASRIVNRFVYAITYDKRRELEQEYEQTELPGELQLLRETAELAQLLGKYKESGFLSDMASLVQRRKDWGAMTPKQQDYVSLLLRRFQPKLRELPALRKKEQEKAQLAEEARQQEIRRKEEEEKELLELSRDLAHDGWKHTKGFHTSWTLEIPGDDQPIGKVSAPWHYFAVITVDVRDYGDDDLVYYLLAVPDDLRGNFEQFWGKAEYILKQTRLRFKHPDLEESAKYAQKRLEGGIRREQLKRQKLKEAPPEPVAPPPPPAAAPTNKAELIDRLQRLAEAAKADDARFNGFLRGLIAQLNAGKSWESFSDKQRAWVERGYEKYKV